MKYIITVLLSLVATSAWGQCSPIVVDLKGDGVHLGPKGVGVNFDVNADGFDNFVQWVRAGGDEAFLALDKNRNGLVDDGSELFGVGTQMPDGSNAVNGFVALAPYDSPQMGGNDDGLISDADPIWTELSVWLDKNADGIATAREMHRPWDLGLKSFETIPKARRMRDAAGNALPYRAWARRVGKKKVAMVDVYFLELRPT